MEFRETEVLTSMSMYSENYLHVWGNIWIYAKLLIIGCIRKWGKHLSSVLFPHSTWTGFLDLETTGTVLYPKFPGLSYQWRFNNNRSGGEGGIFISRSIHINACTIKWPQHALKADRLHSRYYPYMPPDYRQTDRWTDRRTLPSAFVQ